MHQITLPRVSGRDDAGVVERGPAERVGAEVWGTGGDVDFTRDGTHARCVAVPIASLRRKPARLTFDEAACVGVKSLTAWRALSEAAALAAGETLVIIGAAGSADRVVLRSQA